MCKDMAGQIENKNKQGNNSQYDSGKMEEYDKGRN